MEGIPLHDPACLYIPDIYIYRSPFGVHMGVASMGVWQGMLGITGLPHSCPTPPLRGLPHPHPLTKMISLSHTGHLLDHLVSLSQKRGSKGLLPLNIG